MSTLSPRCAGSQDKGHRVTAPPVTDEARGLKNGFTWQHTLIRKPREGSNLMACEGLYLPCRPSLVHSILISCTDVAGDLPGLDVPTVQTLCSFSYYVEEVLECVNLQSADAERALPTVK